MTTLAPQLSTVLENFKKHAPAPVQHSINKAKTDFVASYDPNAAIQVGEDLPDFRLINAVGKEITSTELLAQGALLITFYRGDWCPFCNLALRAMQKHLDDFRAKGVTLVAITPELPDTTLSTTEKNELKFTVLSDVGNKYARQLGILFQQPETLRPVFEQFGHDLKSRNGDDSFAVPIPATILVDQKGIVRNTFIEPDYTKRLEPSEALKWIDAL
ncbi:thioredoxin-like protein [Exophiala viscosa]|uniref:thioredoxin-dependent peroxiredoxin n=1 Tax=Exophiala viscosa TaxID=2486360 RepID=A0AAN6IF73_9EURO|nr:thioredoxin-like protein [Exophiala viscosa]KAI1621716.1 thioredoxin-like protein [Exophiala viscosa]